MSFRNRLRAVKEALVEPYGTAWVGGFRSLWGVSEPPKINREAYAELYEEDPIAKGAVDQNVADALGGGFFTSVGEDEEAKAIVDEFAEKVGLDEIISLMTRDMLVVGDGYAERIYDNEEKRELRVDERRASAVCPGEDAKFVNLKWLPGQTIEVTRMPTGQICWYTQKVDGSTVNFAPEKIMNFKWNPIGKSAYGTSMLSAVYPLLKDLEVVRENFKAVTKRYAKPRFLWRGNALTKEEMNTMKAQVRDVGDDEDFYVNTDRIAPEPIPIDPRGRFENYYIQLLNSAMIGLGTPTLPILESATLASSKSILEFYERKIALIRRIVKRGIEREVFAPLVSPRETPRVRWEIQKTRFEELDISAALGVMKEAEYSTWQIQQVLQKWGFPRPQKEGEGNQ